MCEEVARKGSNIPTIGNQHNEVWISITTSNYRMYVCWNDTNKRENYMENNVSKGELTFLYVIVEMVDIVRVGYCKINI
jgi:hypothetical protein